MYKSFEEWKKDNWMHIDLESDARVIWNAAIECHAELNKKQTVTLNMKQAQLLRAIMQNPMHDKETEEENDLRKTIFSQIHVV